MADVVVKKATVKKEGSVFRHLRGTSRKDKKARKKFKTDGLEDTCAECLHTVESHLNERGKTVSMVAAHCYEVDHEDKVLLITTCSPCSRNGSKGNEKGKEGASWKSWRRARIVYLLDDGEHKPKSHGDYDHDNKKSKLPLRNTRNHTKNRKQTTRNTHKSITVNSQGFLIDDIGSESEEEHSESDDVGWKYVKDGDGHACYEKASDPKARDPPSPGSAPAPAVSTSLADKPPTPPRHDVDPLTQRLCHMSIGSSAKKPQTSVKWGIPLKKDGTPNRNYTSPRPLNKDGSLNMKFAINKKKATPTSKKKATPASKKKAKGKKK